MIPEPTIKELLEVAATSVRGNMDSTADFIRGSDYESLLGPSAVIWSREAARDTDLFNAVNFNTADGEDLTVMAKKRYGKDRILDTRGAGTVVVSRPAGGTSETFWKGSEFHVSGPQPKVYRATQNTVVSSSALLATVPIEAVEFGPGVAVDVTAGVNIADRLTDSTWRVDRLSCGDGTLFEKAEAFRARIRQERRDARVGQTKAIIKACNAAGAASVALFRSDFAGDDYDHGLNVCYVGDLGNNGSPELVKACTLALEKVRVGGDHLQVLPMARTALNVTATVTLYDAPPLFDLKRLERIHVAALSQYLGGLSGRYDYSVVGLESAIARHTPEVQAVTLSTPSVDAAIVEGTNKNFPAVLYRYVLGQVSIRYVGP
jgi:hypothetical protein